MKQSDSPMSQEWGPLDSEAYYDAPIGAPDHLVVRLLAEYHASYAQREHFKKLHYTYLNEAYAEIGDKYKKKMRQLLKAGKPIPESLNIEEGEAVILLMAQKKWPAVQPPSRTSKRLSHFVEYAITHNNPKSLHDLANAIKKIHGDGKRIKGRISGVGPTFEIEPHDPVLVAGLKLRAAQKLSSSKVDFQKAVQQATGLQMGDKKAQRTLRKLGVPPSKGGRPRKHHPKNGHG